MNGKKLFKASVAVEPPKGYRLSNYENNDFMKIPGILNYEVDIDNYIREQIENIDIDDDFEDIKITLKQAIVLVHKVSDMHVYIGRTYISDGNYGIGAKSRWKAHYENINMIWAIPLIFTVKNKIQPLECLIIQLCKMLEDHGKLCIENKELSLGGKVSEDNIQMIYLCVSYEYR